MSGRSLTLGLADVSEANKPILWIDRLSLAYDSMPVIDFGPMELSAGEVVSIVGRSGSGKTTLLSCLSGQIPSAAGTFYIEGIERGIGLRDTFVSRTLQNFPLLHWRDVRGNLALAARIRGVRQPDFDRILASFSARELADRFPSSLSGGERCRASLSQALLGEPKLLLLDEPFAGLDTVVKQLVAGNIFAFAKASDAGVLFVSHDLHDAVEFSDRVLVLGSSRPAMIVGEILSDAPEALKRVTEMLVAN